MNRPAPENPPDLTEGPPLTMRTGQITMAEVKRALKTLKHGKAADHQKPGRKEAWSGPRSSSLSPVQDLECGERPSGLEAGPPV